MRLYSIRKSNKSDKTNRYCVFSNVTFSSYPKLDTSYYKTILAIILSYNLQLSSSQYPSLTASQNRYMQIRQVHCSIPYY